MELGQSTSIEHRVAGLFATEPITEITEWHRHHIVWRANGGKDTTENLVLLHPECHRQVHSQKLEVVKPRLEKGV
jgi:RNA-directed DNA polymerase